MSYRNLFLFAASSSVLLGIFSATYYSNRTNSYRTLAQDPNPPGSPAWCADHCNPSPATNPCNQSSTYNFPSCCNDIAASGDPFACGWPDRGYCLLSQCDSIPSDVNRQRCGGPKTVWCSECTSNNCPGYGSPTATPTQPPQPSATPPPIRTPTPTNINTPTPQTTLTQAPTNTPPLYPTVTLTPTPTFLFTSPTPTSIFLFPSTAPGYPTATLYPQQPYPPLQILPLIRLPEFTFTFPQITLPDLVSPVEKKAPLALDLFEYIFQVVTTEDKKLEWNINRSLYNFYRELQRNQGE